MQGTGEPVSADEGKTFHSTIQGKNPLEFSYKKIEKRSSKINMDKEV